MRVYASFDQANPDREYSPISLIDDRSVYLEQYAPLSNAAKTRQSAETPPHST